MRPGPKRPRKRREAYGAKVPQNSFNEAGAEKAPETSFGSVSSTAPKGFNEAGAEKAPETVIGGREIPFLPELQ